MGINQQVRKGRDDEVASVVFIGPPSCGKKVSLLLLHQTLIDYSHEFGCRYTPIIRAQGYFKN